MQPISANFGFLKEHDPLFLQLATAAEQAFAHDPNTTLIKLRQLGEAFAQHIAVRLGLKVDDQASQVDLLYAITKELGLDPTIKMLFHTLRVEGNKAVHQFKTAHKEALDGLKVARALAVWFHQSFGQHGSTFKAGAFKAPSDPSQQLQNLQQEIEQLRAGLIAANQQLDSNHQLNQLLAQEKAEYAQLAELMDQEARSFAQQAKQYETVFLQQQQDYEQRLKTLQSQLAAQTVQVIQLQKQQLLKQSAQAAKKLSLSEELTRILIDQQLQEAGWQTDTQRLTYDRGARPEKGVNQAISEWPTSLNGEKGRADYVLFRGLTPIAVVEAKKENLNVAGKIRQAERYAKGFQLDSDLVPAWELQGLKQPWGDGQKGHYTIPFVYSCNGRAYVPQLPEQSGTWFRDVRTPHELSRPLQQFHTPDGLLDMLRRSKEQAEHVLKTEGFDYLKLRDYQHKAIVAVEKALANHQRRCLLAMATGTGKTRTIIGLMYRFLKSERFKRILFLVDRTALGQQALDAFHEAPLEQNQTLSKIYNIAELGDMAAEAETRVQVATVQAMLKRLFMSDAPPSVDQFDCIIVDEAHRGYTLDQEMTEGELQTRDVTQYLSSYRRVLEYFDAIKIGLTATPAKHTSDIFGKPVYTYSYREAVADDWLIDHEPPIRYETLLSKHGIHFDKGSQVSVVNTQTGHVESAELEDELNFDVESFNRRVISENFNRVICQELAKELDPFGEEKTLIFCATDLHADMVKRLLNEEFKQLYADYNQDAVAKITGQSDKVEQLIRQYKNERFPNIAITVDLLTTGIDVPKITHVVFMRRVKSRILYEQMMGRATRRCDDIGKTVFKIYDPVDIYATLQDVNTMKPLVKDPNITLEQLYLELSNPAHLQLSLQAVGEVQGETQAHAILNQLSQKLMRVLRKADSKASRPNQQFLKEKLRELESLWGVEPVKLPQHLHQLGPEKASQFLQQHTGLLQQVQEINSFLATDYYPVISEHADELVLREQSYGQYQKPADFLQSFNHFIQTQLNASAALSVVVTKPRDLTRAQLKEIKLLLDGAGYSEAKLQTAWRNQTNQEIAASIIGYIRQAALGEALIPFEQRVNQALQKIYSQHAWNTAQKRWLERLARQLSFEVVMDRAFINDRFADQGGSQQLDRLLANQLDTVLSEFAEALWPVAS